MPTRHRSLLFTACSILISLVAQTASAAVNSEDYAVLLSADIDISSPHIRLTWPEDPNATGYTVYRKALDADAWGSKISLPGHAISYNDNDVNVGDSHEYRVSKTAYDRRSNTRYTGHGYIYAGIRAPLIEERGKLVLVVDDTHAGELAEELIRLEQDLVGDGWRVLRHDVSRNASVSDVKALIQSRYQTDPENVKAVFLFGHVPVPYSGDQAFDGHPDHRGAWPADAFYGDMDDAGWSDRAVNTGDRSGPRREENRNVPGDGKFDPSFLPSDVELQVGRVDLSDMPAFPDSELELLRQYLDKNHDFRHKHVSYPARGLIDDKFGPFRGFAMAASGWRNFAPFFGADNIDEDKNFDDDTTFDWFPRLKEHAYLWGYGSAGGSYSSAGDAPLVNGMIRPERTGLGETGPGAAPPLKIIPPGYNFVDGDPQVVFTMLFGSYFGDWDSTNNFLRAPLATGHGLTAIWAGSFPHGYFHHMALGKTIGYSTRLTQNNEELYTNDRHRHTRGIHIALMGDPTLRMHPVGPPGDLTGTVTEEGVRLDWQASLDEGIQGYHVYRARVREGNFTRLTRARIDGTQFTDSDVSSGNYTYMVRAVKLEQTPSGSYLNPSQGVFQRLHIAPDEERP